MQLFYFSDFSQNRVELPEEESKHIARVLRKQKGDSIILIDGKGNKTTGIITNNNSKKCEIELQEIINFSKNRSYHLHIAIAPTKQFERMDWFLEKAIEIGIDEITFIESTNSERNKINTERCLKIAISAIKQSKQFWLPQINPIKKLADFLKEYQETDATKIIACCTGDQNRSLSQLLNNSNNKNIICLIGPEGDFTEEEIILAHSCKFQNVSFGSNILRTETAGVFVCASVAFCADQMSK